MLIFAEINWWCARLCILDVILLGVLQCLNILYVFIYRFYFTTGDCMVVDTTRYHFLHLTSVFSHDTGRLLNS